MCFIWLCVNTEQDTLHSVVLYVKCFIFALRHIVATEVRYKLLSLKNGCI